MEIILLVVLQVVVAFAIVALVLVQQGKGADVGAAFGSGASNTMFGSTGSTSFLMKVTMLLGAIFFCTSLGLNYVGAHSVKHATSQHGFLNLPTMEAPVAKASLPVTSKSTKTLVSPSTQSGQNAASLAP